MPDGPAACAGTGYGADLTEAAESLKCFFGGFFFSGRAKPVRKNGSEAEGVFFWRAFFRL